MLKMIVCIRYELGNYNSNHTIYMCLLPYQNIRDTSLIGYFVLNTLHKSIKLKNNIF